MPGVGKSFFGEKISRKLEFKFIDLDTQIENKCQNTIFYIFKKYGEDYFREIEREELIKIIANCRSNTIIATGGGTPLHHNLMNIMNETGITIWLNSDVNFLIQNIIKQKSKRPILKNDENLKQNLEQLYNQRKEIYSRSKLNIVVNEDTKVDLFTNSLLLSTFE